MLHENRPKLRPWLHVKLKRHFKPEDFAECVCGKVVFFEFLVWRRFAAAPVERLSEDGAAATQHVAVGAYLRLNGVSRSSDNERHVTAVLTCEHSPTAVQQTGRKLDRSVTGGVNRRVASLRVCFAHCKQFYNSNNDINNYFHW